MLLQQTPRLQTRQWAVRGRGVWIKNLLRHAVSVFVANDGCGHAVLRASTMYTRRATGRANTRHLTAACQNACLGA